jgi:hypothetical protein
MCESFPHTRDNVQPQRVLVIHVKLLVGTLECVAANCFCGGLDWWQQPTR